jgi:Fe-S-cluster containining protein
MSDKITDFKCGRCGTCCKWSGYVRLREGELEDIAAFLEMAPHEFAEKYTVLTRDRRGLSLIEREDGSCIFFEDSPPVCLINAVKPQQCRDFPLRWNFPGWEKECAGAQSH